MNATSGVETRFVVAAASLTEICEASRDASRPGGDAGVRRTSPPRAASSISWRGERQSDGLKRSFAP